MKGMAVLMVTALAALQGLCFPVQGFAQEDEAAAAPPPMDFAERGVIPPVLRQPRQGEILRYPRDLIIGELGRGQASEGAYAYAENVLSALLLENRTSRFLSGQAAAFWDEPLANLAAISPRKYRLGGGAEGLDGSSSFLFRFIGRERGIAGELYIRRNGDAWALEDIIFERARALPSGKQAYPYDFSPYERFW